MYVIRHSTYQNLIAGKDEKYEKYEDAEKVIATLTSASLQNLWYVDGANMQEELIFDTFRLGRKASKVFNAVTDLIKLPNCMKFKTVQEGNYYSFSVIYNADAESVKVVEALKAIAEALYA